MLEYYTTLTLRCYNIMILQHYDIRRHQDAAKRQPRDTQEAPRRHPRLHRAFGGQISWKWCPSRGRFFVGGLCGRFPWATRGDFRARFSWGALVRSWSLLSSSTLKSTYENIGWPNVLISLLKRLTFRLFAFIGWSQQNYVTKCR